MDLVNGPEDAATTFIFAHGAGAPMDSGFMSVIADGLAARGLRVVRFEFPYMAARRGQGGKSRGPDRAPVLLATFHERVAAERARLPSGARLAIGGKSMGGRIASMVADEASVDALVCFGYPFWPPQKRTRGAGDARDDARTRHLETLRTRALILQGTRDPFGGEAETASLRIAPRIEWVPDGDHDFAPRKRSFHTHEGNLALATDRAAAFLLRSS